jgi:hypothetical protein
VTTGDTLGSISQQRLSDQVSTITDQDRDQICADHGVQLADNTPPGLVH